jgi:cobalt ECF transporter T component CbiQ
MLEWLSRDPLNGIVITIAFFISLIIGRYLRNEKDRTNNKMDSRIKILVSFLLIIVLTLMEHWYFPLMIVALCFGIALRKKVARPYGKMLIFPVVLALFIMAVQGFNFEANSTGWRSISVNPAGLEYGFLIFSRVFASASVLILLLLTTSKNELLESMRTFGVPKTLLEISTFMFRYIKTFSHEGEKIKLAQESRCSMRAGLVGRVRNIASVSGALITRAFTKSESVHRAMLSRGWKPGFGHSSDYLPLNKGDMALGIIISSGIFILLGLDWIL